MGNIDYKNIELTEGVPTNTGIDEKENEIRVFKENCNLHLRSLASEYLALNGLLKMLEDVIEEDDGIDYSTCEVIKLLREESDTLQESTENYIYPEEEGETSEDLKTLKNQFNKFLKSIFDDTMELNAVSSVLVEAMKQDEQENKICYILTVKMAVKKLNDVIERIVVLLKD